MASRFSAAFAEPGLRTRCTQMRVFRDGALPGIRLSYLVRGRQSGRDGSGMFHKNRSTSTKGVIESGFIRASCWLC